MDWQPFAFALPTVATVAYTTAWIKNKLGPAKKLAMQQESPLFDLKKAGFVAATAINVGDGSELDEAVGYVGQVEDYAVEIAYNFLWGVLVRSPYFRIRVFFNPGPGDRIVLQARLAQHIGHSKLFRWSTTEKLAETYAEIEMNDGKFSRLSAQELLVAAQQLTQELKRLNLPPIAYETGIILTKKVAE